MSKFNLRALQQNAVLNAKILIYKSESNFIKIAEEAKKKGITFEEYFEKISGVELFSQIEVLKKEVKTLEEKSQGKLKTKSLKRAIKDLEILAKKLQKI